MQLHGMDWQQLNRFCGRRAQACGIAHYKLCEGVENEVEVYEVRTGSGFSFQICPTRGLDIISATHNGRSLCWQSPTDFAHPKYFSDDNLGWLRVFGGGLLATCGLQSFGPACEDDGERFGLHDRIGLIPASNVCAHEDADGNFTISGNVRQTRVFGANLLLQRTISARAGDNFLTMRDRVTNEGFAPAPCVILYHCNFGWPVVSAHSTVKLPASTCRPRDAVAARGLENWQQMEAPQNKYDEQVFFHEVAPDENGRVHGEIWNADISFGAYLAYDARALHYLTQWKMMGAGTYVCGLEPSNAPLASRTELKVRGELPVLGAGQSWEFRVELGALL